ncbi:hypothetical protein ACLVWU_17360 [Bdellovibrio sp. HCB290]|uniref:hypothetical protein n=1 Tax=Bdellovibrio sp. HCB290 TaxID=3394356 RepID=UPI0039B4ACD2
MRFLAVILFSMLESGALAAENFNHITCEYQQNESGWEFAAVNYNRDGLVLQPGESKAIVGGWTSSREVNVGFCLAFTGVAETSQIQNTFLVFEGQEILGVDPNTCQPFGKGITILKSENTTSRRGEVVDMSVENWFDQGGSTLLMRHYVPTQTENSKVTEIAAAKCAELRP